LPLTTFAKRFAAPAVVALTVWWLGYRSGGYSELERAPVAIAMWWAIILLVVLRIWPRAAVPRAAVAAVGLFAAFVLWIGASALWAPSVEDVLVEFDRATLYLGAAVVGVIAVRRGEAARWLDGIAAAIAGIAAVALVSRLFPGSFSLRGLPQFLPSSQARLSFPVDYWNGLAILIGIGVPLLLRAAVDATQSVVRGLALAPLPAFAAALYLTASRGGFLTATLGAICFLAATANRWRTLAAAATATTGAAVAIAILLDRPELVDGPIDSAAATSQGHSAAFLLAGLCIATGGAWAAVSRVRPGAVRLPPVVGWVGLAAVVAVLLAGLVVADPADRFRTFKQVPGTLPRASPAESFARAHLLSGNGSGRWQFWKAAADEFDTAPFHGRGAGTYESWWSEHASFSYFVRDAHSLYLETLGELGLIGFLLLAAAFCTTVAIAVTRLSQADASTRTTIAAALASFVAFLSGAAFDWVWELAVVGGVGALLLGLLVGPATLTGPAVGEAKAGRAGAEGRFALGIAGLVAAWVVLCAQAPPLLSEIKLRDSRAAIGRGDTAGALSDARAARRLEPWAASPHLQLALVLEERNDVSGARREIDQALDRDPRDWRLWLVKARLETKAGAARAAVASYERGRELNPRSTLFVNPQ
jgi:hypothetical protein